MIYQGKGKDSSGWLLKWTPDDGYHVSIVQKQAWVQVNGVTDFKWKLLPSDIIIWIFVKTKYLYLVAAAAMRGNQPTNRECTSHVGGAQTGPPEGQIWSRQRLSWAWLGGEDVPRTKYLYNTDGHSPVYSASVWP